MEAKARLLGHPIHQILIVFPLGLLATAVVFDVIRFISGSAQWSTVAYWLIAAGAVGGLLAAPFGFIDWLGIPAGTRAKRVGIVHGVGNMFVILFFGLSWLLREFSPMEPTRGAYVLSFLGGALALVTGWLGGELVTRLGVGVDNSANVNAPSSLRPTAVPRPRPADV